MMKRTAAILLALLMTFGLCACSNAGEDAATADADAPAGTTADIGYNFTIPEEYADRLIVKTDEEGSFVSVYEKESVEAAQATDKEHSDGAGWLFALGTVSAEKLHQMICYDMSGIDVFAEGADGSFFVYYHPTDVRIVRAENDYNDESLARWTELNEWAASVRADFIAENEGLTAVSYDNSEIAILLVRAAYMEGTKYEVRTLEYGAAGALDPAGVDAAPFAELLIRNASYTYVEPDNTPDGEYIVLYFPEDDIRLDFFLADGNYVRCTNDEGSGSQLFQVSLPDGEGPVRDIMQAWVDAVAAANDLK